MVIIGQFYQHRWNFVYVYDRSVFDKYHTKP